MQEVRFVLRRLFKRPAPMLASALTLAVAIGAASATWSLLSAVVLQPLSVFEPNRLMVVESIREVGPGRMVSDGFVYPTYTHVRDSQVFDRIAAQWSRSLPLQVTIAGLPVLTPVAFATKDFFDVLGIPIAIGRDFADDDDRRGAPPVVILTDRYWRRSFGADPAVLGRTIRVGSRTATIIGVAPRGFRGIDLSQAPDLIMPFHTIADVGPGTINYFAVPGQAYSPTAGTKIIGRLRAGDSTEQVRARLASLVPPPGQRSKPEYILTDVYTASIPAASREGVAQLARLLGATVGLLLLIGCGSVGMLLLVRTEARRDEFAVCMALGASRWRLAKGIAVEGALLSGIGAALSVPVAWWLFWGSRAFQFPGNISIELLDLSVNSRTLIACAGSAILAMMLISVIAGVFGFSANIGDALRSRLAATPRPTRRRTRQVLVVCQVAAALVLLAGAGLFARSIMAALSLNSGLNSRQILTTTVSLGAYGYTNQTAAIFFDELSSRLSVNPAIQSVAFSVTQGGMSRGGQIVIDGMPRQFPSMVGHTMVNPDYFRMMGIPLLRGRDLSQDDRSGGPLVAIVSESFGRMVSNGGNPLGSKITMWYRPIGRPAEVAEIVGVVGDVVTDVSTVEPLDIYFAIAQMGPVLSRTLALRPSGDMDSARREVIAAIKQIDPVVNPGPLQTLDERISSQMGLQKFGAYVMGALGVVAMSLTLLGTYVLAESLAVFRMREMGIRAALGASGRELAMIVLSETLRLVSVGIGVGLVLAVVGANTIRAFLFRVQPLDLATLAVTAGLILLLALAVSLRPAWRAARIDPSVVLNEE